MIFNLSNPFDAEKLLERVRKDIEGGKAVNYARVLPLRTSRQNSYLWVCIGYFASQYGCSKEEAELRFFKATANKDIFYREGKTRNGRVRSYYRSTKELDTGEMTKAIERFRQWSASVADIYIPSPNEDEFILHCRQEIEKNDEYWG